MADYRVRIFDGASRKEKSRQIARSTKEAVRDCLRVARERRGVTTSHTLPPTTPSMNPRFAAWRASRQWRRLPATSLPRSYRPASTGMLSPAAANFSRTLSRLPASPPVLTNTCSNNS